MDIFDSDWDRVSARVKKIRDLFEMNVYIAVYICRTCIFDLISSRLFMLSTKIRCDINTVINTCSYSHIKEVILT